MFRLFSFLSWLPLSIRLLIVGSAAFFLLFLLYRLILAIKELIPFV